VKAGGGQWLLLATEALYFTDPSVGVLLGHGEKLVAGLFDGVFRSQPVEQRLLGLLLGGADFNQALNEKRADGGAFSLVTGPIYALTSLHGPASNLLHGALGAGPLGVPGKGAPLAGSRSGHSALRARATANETAAATAVRAECVTQPLFHIAENHFAVFGRIIYSPFRQAG